MSGAIKLKWQDRNFIETNHLVYRSDTPMDVNALPTPIATLGTNVTTYSDFDVIEGNTYYYRIGAVRGIDIEVSDEWEILANPFNFGPGSNVIIGGDMSVGFFGEVPVEEIISGNDLASHIGLTEGTAYNSDEPWLKFVIDNEIVFIAKKPYRYSVNWNHIYQAGAVYGTGDTGLYPVAGGVIQDKSLIVGNDTLKITLMRGANTDPTAFKGGYDTSITHNSEWNRLMYPIHSGIHTQPGAPTTPSIPYAQWETYSDEDLQMVYQTAGSRCACQETVSTNINNRITRGYAGVTNIQEDAYNISTLLQYRGWRPMLRLVQ